jgi:hypothetical protein
LEPRGGLEAQILGREKEQTTVLILHQTGLVEPTSYCAALQKSANRKDDTLSAKLTRTEQAQPRQLPSWLLQYLEIRTNHGIEAKTSGLLQRKNPL